MTDSTPDPALPPERSAEDSAFEAVLADLLRTVESEASASVPDGALPDASRVSAHFAGPGDAALLDEAARRGDVRRLLADLAAIVTPEVGGVNRAVGSNGAAGSAPSGSVPSGSAPGGSVPSGSVPSGSVPSGSAPSGNGHAPRPLSADVRARAIAAFDGEGEALEEFADLDELEDREHDVAPTSESGIPVLGARARRPTSAWRAAAAVLLVGGSAIGLATFAGRSVEAGPALALEAIERLDDAGRIAAEGPRHARLGQRFVAGDSRRLSLRLAGGARVILGAGDELRVACDGTECGRVALALDHGEALVSAPSLRPLRVPVGELPDGIRILLPDGGVLDVRKGAAHVAVSKTGEPLISLREDGVAYYFQGGSAPFPRTGRFQLLVGPTTNGPAAATLFRDLEFFGGALRRGSLDRDVSAPLWRILRGGAARANGARGALARASDSEGLPAVRFDLAPGETARLAWLPDGAALAAGSLDVRVETRPGNLSPTGRPVPDAPLGRLEVSVAGLGGSSVMASAEVAASHREPGTSSAPGRVELALPSGWAAASAGREVELVFSAKDAPVRAWFTGALFRMPEGAAASERASPGGGR